MPETDKSLMAHLLRRAGFGATFQELDRYCQMGYQASVDEILHPEQHPAIEEDVLDRYSIDWKVSRNIVASARRSARSRTAAVAICRLHPMP